ncbi:methyltransferase domain-containing protein [bacterium CPR1]|nr:methyltransferase domain-containing protein [bacterium CPR1]
MLPLSERVVMPGLVLNLAEPPQRPLSTEERGAYLREPLFWAFCWPAGRVLGAHLLAHPELVRGKTVCDLGAGSGVVALAAARAGAARVLACDIDPAARLACRHNAARNGLEIVVCEQPEPCDLILAADLLYEPANRHWLKGLCLVADSRGEPGEGFRLLGWHDSAPLPDLGFESGFRRVGLWAGQECVAGRKTGPG